MTALPVRTSGYAPITLSYADIHLVIAGHRIAHGVHGDGEPVVLIHGTPSSTLLRRGVVPELVEAGSRAHVCDLLGCGLSERPADRLRSLTLVDVVSFDSCPSPRTRQQLADGLEAHAKKPDGEHREHFRDWLLSTHARPRSSPHEVAVITLSHLDAVSPP